MTQDLEIIKARVDAFATAIRIACEAQEACGYPSTDPKKLVMDCEAAEKLVADRKSALLAEVERLTVERDETSARLANWQITHAQWMEATKRAETALAEVKAENERLREGLAPFAAVADAMDGPDETFAIGIHGGGSFKKVVWGDFRHARALLQKGPNNAG